MKLLLRSRRCYQWIFSIQDDSLHHAFTLTYRVKCWKRGGSFSVGLWEVNRLRKFGSGLFLENKHQSWGFSSHHKYSLSSWQVQTPFKKRLCCSAAHRPPVSPSSPAFCCHHTFSTLRSHLAGRLWNKQPYKRRKYKKKAHLPMALSSEARR